LYWVGNSEEILGEIERFVTGAGPAPRSERVLATILFTDIASSTAHAAELGDERWREVLDRHDAVVARQIDRFRGHTVKTTGDGVLATFDGPAKAIACARAIRDGARQLGVDVRAGIHTGEVELLESDIAGLAVHIGQRICANADPGEILVSRTVVDLVVGSGIRFSDRDDHQLKGVPGTWRMFAVEE
jgi:class 3 adenylate cyclase